MLKNLYNGYMLFLQKKESEPLLKQINPVVRYLMLSDNLVLGALGMFSPFLVLFVEKHIDGGNEFVAGIALSIYLASKSLLQIPVATTIDKIKGEKDDYVLLIGFSFISAFLNISLLSVSKIWHLYAFEFLSGLSAAVTYPAFMAIFTKHIDKGMEGTEWGVYYTLTNLCGAFLAGLGGYIAKNYGLPSLIIATTILNFIGAIFLIPIRFYIKEFKKKGGFPL